jgi:diguanylate cyclase (GGDEF)-like protein
MGLDIKTLFVADVAVLLVSAALSLYFWHRDRDGNWLLWWASGTAATAASLLIFGFFRAVPRPVVGFPAATLAVGGLLLVWQSMRGLNGKPPLTGWLVALVAAFVTVLSVAVVLGADLRERSGLLMVAMALSASACAWEVHFGVPTPWRGRLLLVALFVVVAALLALTAVLTGLGSHGPVASLRDLLGDFLPLVNSLAILCLCFYVTLIINERARSRYRKFASTDELTGLPNRRYFMEEATRSARQDGSPACLLMMDLDHFSDVNRRFGHAGGDEALRAFSEELRQGMRSTDIVARYGGEEFCAYLGRTAIGEAVRIAERLREAVASLSVELKGQSIGITVSIGVAQVRDSDLIASVSDADQALYAAKGQGRNRVAIAPGDAAAPPGPGKSRLRIVR